MNNDQQAGCCGCIIYAVAFALIWICAVLIGVIYHAS